MRSAIRWAGLASLVAATLWLASATASAEVVHVYGDGFYGWGGGYYPGYYPVTVQRRIPYFAAHPPVYYDGIVPRAYGWSPYAYPPYSQPPTLRSSPPAGPLLEQE